MPISVSIESFDEALDAIIEDDYEAVQREITADPDLLTAVAPDTGATLLMIASIYGRTEIVKLLLDHGADPRQENAGGATAVEYAAENEHDHIQDLLRTHVPSSSFRSQ